jgi:hypothetical protein
MSTESSSSTPAIWFPREEDLWVPSEGPLSKFLLRRIEESRNHTAFASYDTLVSVNPNHYSPEADAACKSAFDQVWDKLRQEPKRVQSVVVVGDSGSGKTVAFGKLLASIHEEGAIGEGLWLWYRHADCLLRAFGNASIPRNHNSSRFVNILQLSVTAGEAT